MNAYNFHSSPQESNEMKNKNVFSRFIFVFSVENNPDSDDACVCVLVPGWLFLFFPFVRPNAFNGTFPILIESDE